MNFEPSLKSALVLEDVLEASATLADQGYTVTRVTHAELMSTNGQLMTARLLKGIKPRERRTATHYSRIANWITRANNLQMIVILMGPPGPLWKQTIIQKAITDGNMYTQRMRLCHFGDKFNTAEDRPSGSYIAVSTSLELAYQQWSCKCKCDFEKHVLDWYGQSEAHGGVERKNEKKIRRHILPGRRAEPLHSTARTKGCRDSHPSDCAQKHVYKCMPTLYMHKLPSLLHTPRTCAQT